MKSMVLLALVGALVWADPDSVAKFEFPDPSKPKHLKIDVSMSDIRVRAGNVTNVEVDLKGGWKTWNKGKLPKDAEGLKRVQLSNSRDVTAKTEGNMIVISGWNGGGTFTVTVPPDTNLKLHTAQGDIVVEGVKGEIEANTSMGKVHVVDAVDAVVAHSSMGEVVVSMAQMPRDKALSLVSMMGKIDLTLPGDAKATLLVRETSMTDLYSDFEVVSAGTVQKEAAYKDRKWTRSLSKANINGGGPEINLSSSMGDIMIRRRK